MSTATLSPYDERFRVRGLTVEERFKNAWSKIRRAGVVTRVNVMSCCRSCAGADPQRWFGVAPEACDTTPVVWTYGGQGGRVRWVDGLPFYADAVTSRRNGWTRTHTAAQLLASHSTYRPTLVTEVCVYHSGPGVEAAKIAKDAFESEGFTVDWDGTEHRAVCVTLVPEPKDETK